MIDTLALNGLVVAFRTEKRRPSESICNNIFVISARYCEILSLRTKTTIFLSPQRITYAFEDAIIHSAYLDGKNWRY